MYVKKIGNRYNKNPRSNNNYNKDTSVEFPISEEPKKVVKRPATRSKRQTKPKTRAQRAAEAQQKKKSSGGSSRTFFFIIALIAYGAYQFLAFEQSMDYEEYDFPVIEEAISPEPEAVEEIAEVFPAEVVVPNEILTAESNKEIELQTKIGTTLAEFEQELAKYPNGMNELSPLFLIKFSSIQTIIMIDEISDNEIRPAFAAQKKGEVLLSLYDLDLSAKVYDNLYKGINFSGANLKNANLENAYLVGIDLSNADLSNANLTGANVVNANFEGANLEGAILPE